MLVNNITTLRIDKRKYREGDLSAIHKIHDGITTSVSQNNYRDIERPLKTSDLSFKGLSLYNAVDKVYSKSDFLEFADKYIGPIGRKLLHDLTVARSDRTKDLIKIDGDNITLYKKSIPHLAWDGILYPFKILPGDILNGVVESLGKIPFLKDWSKKTLNHSLFKNIRQRSKIDSKVNSLIGMITYRDEKLAQAIREYESVNGVKADEKIIENLKQKVTENLESMTFQTSVKPFDYKTGNYDTKHERALNRLVSGLPPAIFLANDAYNLSRMMDDDPKAAKKEQKTRFRQETSRILTSGYLTLITMGAFQKFINNSKMGIVLTTGITVLLTEMFSRLSNGKHITRLTPEQARLENQRMHAPEAEIKPIDNKKSAQVSSTGAPIQDKSKETQKPLLSFDTLMKASAVVLALGYGIKGFKHLPAVKNSALEYFKNMNPEKLAKLGIKTEDLKPEKAVKLFEDNVIYKPFTDFYKKITTDAYLINPEKFNKTVEVLRENGFKVQADAYEKLGKTVLKQVDGKQVIDLGLKDRKIKPLVNFVIAPFKFMWNTVTLPYWMIDEKILSVFKKAKPKSAPKDIQALNKSFEKISKKVEDLIAGKIDKNKFQDFIEVNLARAFNADSLSSVSNAELSNLAKTAASIATIWFLMTDNYNMVMLKSNGNDKEGAKTKFTERFVQEGSRLFYQTLLIDLFNSTFCKQYNAALWGMSWVTLADTTLGEILTRSSVGIPTKTHTRQELIDIETKQNNSTGFKKKYYNFMQRLTGKRSIKTYEVKPIETAAVPPAFSSTQFNSINNQSKLQKIIKS